MDIIYITDLRVETLIGVWTWERRIRQTLVFDLELGTDIRRAGASDALADTIDYQAVSDRVRGFAAASEFQLVEALAENIARIILTEFDIEWVKLRITKQGVMRNVRQVGIQIERSRAP